MKFLEFDKMVSDMKKDVGKLSVTQKEIQQKVAKAMVNGVGSSKSQQGVQISQAMIDQFVKHEDYNAIK